VHNDGTILRNKYAVAEKKFIKEKEKNPHMTQLQLQEVCALDLVSSDRFNLISVAYEKVQ
jgi:hypothetical protein